MQFVYIGTKGASDATAASLPLHLAVNGSVEVGHDVAVVLVGDATDILLDDNVHALQGVGVPAMSELVTKLREHEIPVYV